MALTALIPLNPSALLASFLAGALGLGFYRLYFHPLARYPGPKLAAATYWYATYHEVWRDGEFVDHIQSLHEKYGPVVRVGPNDLHFNSPQAYSDIYVKGYKFTKDPAFYHKTGGPGASTFLIDPQASKARRDIVGPFFSRRTTLALEHIVQDKVKLLVDQVLKYEGGKKPANLHRAYRSATLDIVTAYCFDKDYAVMQASDFAHKLLLDLEFAFAIFLWQKNFSWLLTPFRMLWTLIDQYSSEAYKDVFQLSAKQIDELVNTPERLESLGHETVWHHLLIQHPEKGELGKVPDTKALMEEVINLLAAGGDTVGNTCTMGTFFILSDPGVRRRLVEELKDAWPNKDNEMSSTALEKLPYLTAVIKESLRLSHGVVLPAPRVVRPTDAIIDGFTIPMGSGFLALTATVVATGSTFLHYNPETFPDPYTFNPNRWLQPDAAKLESCFASFSKGPRTCLAVNLAWCELYLLFGYMFRRVDMELFDTTIADMKFKSHFTPTMPKGRFLHCTVRGTQD